MPCQSGYLAATWHEKERKRAAVLLRYVRLSLRIPVGEELQKQHLDYYGVGPDRVPELCELLTEMDSEDLEFIVYNAHSKTARDLADWWEDHQEADVARVKKEDEDARAELQTALEAVDRAKAKIEAL